MFFTVQEILNDSLGAPMCTGTGYVARRSALESIGGWPLAFTGEDYMLSALLAGHGWEVAFVREPMQVGLAPESLRALLEQRMRWVSEELSYPLFQFLKLSVLGLIPADLPYDSVICPPEVVDVR